MQTQNKIFLIFCLALVVILGLGETKQAKEAEAPPKPLPIDTAKVLHITLPPITYAPTPIDVWFDTCANRYDVPASVIRGVALHESGSGKSRVAKQANNLFGIKCGDGWNGDRFGVWRKYDTPYDSVEDFCLYIISHYPWLRGRKPERWLLHGYGAKAYTVYGWVHNFDNSIDT